MSASGSSISAYVDRWRQGEHPSAAAVLREHPELARSKSAVLDLAYEEFCLRREAGESIAPSTFCNQFPTYCKSLERLIGVHELLAGNGALAELANGIDWPAAGDELLGFNLREELGKGALGRVFLASEPALGDRLVVLKLSRHGGREAEMLGRLAHPNIVPVYSARQDAETGLTVVCMPFLGTATLCDVIDRAVSTTEGATARTIREAASGAASENGPATTESPSPDRRFQSDDSYVNRILEIAASLAGALAFTHSRGVLHRDIKPSNVLLTTAGVPMLLDFNLSSDERTQELRVGGTLPYASPEQLRGLSGESTAAGRIDGRSDVFSLGVVLYELLTGSLPFGSRPSPDSHDSCDESSHRTTSAAKQILARQRAGAVPLRIRNPLLDAAAAGVVERCLRFDPAGRPASAGELERLLRKSLAPRQRLARWSRRHRRLSAASLALITGLAIWTTVTVATRPSLVDRTRATANQKLADGHIDEAVELFSLALKDSPNDVASRLGRAAAQEKAKDYVGAARDYKVAAEFSPDGSIHAAAAYCYAREGLYIPAVACSRLAMAAHFETAELYNNLGYCELQQGLAASAHDHLDRALALNPTLMPARYNRARAELKLLVGQAHIPLKTGLEDMDQAAAAEPARSELLFDAACLNAAAPAELNRQATAKRYLIAGLKAGLPHEKVTREPLLARLRESPDVKELLESPTPRRTAPPPVQVMPIAANPAAN